MTTSPTLTGQDIGQAERAMRAVLDRLLATTGFGFHGGVILNVLAASGGRLTQGDLVGRVMHALKIGEPAVRDALAEVAGLGLIRRPPAADGDPLIEITAAGTAQFRQVREDIAEVTKRLYGGIPETDLATAHRVLATVTERANAELAN